jgi:hypothetical protein
VNHYGMNQASRQIEFDQSIFSQNNTITTHKSEISPVNSQLINQKNEKENITIPTHELVVM